MRGVAGVLLVIFVGALIGSFSGFLDKHVFKFGECFENIFKWIEGLKFRRSKK